MSLRVQVIVADRVVFVADTEACPLTDAEAVNAMWRSVEIAPRCRNITVTVSSPGDARPTYYYIDKQ